MTIKSLTVLVDVFSVSYECKTFSDAHEALHHMKNSGAAFDCIICDLIMPKMNGKEFYTALKAIRPEFLARVIFMTGGSYSSHPESCKNHYRTQ